jgi:two-component sensor histidine kinase
MDVPHSRRFLRQRIGFADNTDVEDLMRAEEAVRKQVSEINILNERLKRSMAETHHRVRNNLQIISAFADMQAMEDPETVPVREFVRISGQVRVLAAVHDILTEHAKAGEDTHSVSAPEVLRKLAALLQQTAHCMRVMCHFDEVRLPTRQATSLAIITNELILNALKYGKSEVLMRLCVHDGELRRP